MLREADYRKDYTAFMNKIISKGFAYKVPESKMEAKPGSVWYLPHHGVYHAKKKKIRVVFDCSAKYNGSSLNDRLLQGPNLTNALVGVLTRFRQGPVAFMGDIESMFYQVNVPEHQHDFLRFLWWTDDDLQGDIAEYCMSVHIFGAVSSPSVCNYALRRTADKAEDLGQVDVASTIRRNFYVDDCLKAVKTEKEASSLIKRLMDGCAKGGFRLTKFTSNSKEVVKTIPEADVTKTVKDLDFDDPDDRTERTLGAQWRMDADTLGFSINMEERPLTRRGLLSIVSAVYDPLGFVAPFVLLAKKLLQELCKDEQLGWDEDISDDHKLRWYEWKKQLPLIESVEVERCIMPGTLVEPISKQLHIFSDASTIGYGSVAYIRLCDKDEKIHTAFLLGKARLAPIKTLSIPRLELTAAAVSVKIGQYLVSEMDIEFDRVIYHTDATTVLHYIRNQKKRFPVFVANRVKMINDFTTPSQWKFVESKSNPADCASRGMKSKELTVDNKWLNGPDFLRAPESEWPEQPEFFRDGTSSTEEDQEASTTASFAQLTAQEGISTLIEHYSSWYKLKRAVAIYRRVFSILKQRRQGLVASRKSLSVEELDLAGRAIIRWSQSQVFSKELDALQRKDSGNNEQRGRAQDQRGRAQDQRGRVQKASVLKGTSSVYRLNPFWDEEGAVIRVGGRLSRTNLPDAVKYPILLPYKHHVTSLIIASVHKELGHTGRNHVLATLREKYWIVKGNSAVRNVISKCVTCRRLYAPVNEQKMSDLPSDRVNPAPPFTNTGVDYFGPFLIKEGRKLLKRYGVLFTCLVSRAIHIETANSLETDSFIQALRRFIARRGNVRFIRSDNGTNFVGAERELRQAVQEMDKEKVSLYLLKASIDWTFNPPSASHFGGVWERQIRTVRKVLASLLLDHGDCLDDESYRTLLCEVEAIVNSRPITTVSDSPNDYSPLTPNDILNINTGGIVPLPGTFQRCDVYMRKRWRRVQYLANVFWSRWRKEYLLTLQERQKWNKVRRNMTKGDVVIIKDDTLSRNEWSMGRVCEVETDNKGFVRGAKIKTQKGFLRRPVAKLVLLLPVEEQMEV